MAAAVDKRAAKTVCRLRYRLVHVRVLRAGHDLACSRQPTPELAAFVVTSARPVQVRQRGENGLWTGPNPGERFPNLTLHVRG